MSAFFKQYWRWMAGIFGLVVVVRQWKVATDPNIFNAATSTQVPYAHAGGATQTNFVNGVSITLAPPSETGINVGSENGSIVMNAYVRANAVNSGIGNFYDMVDPQSGKYSRRWIHTAWAIADTDGDGNPDSATLIYDPNPDNDSKLVLPIGDKGAFDPSGDTLADLQWYFPKLNLQTVNTALPF